MTWRPRYEITLNKEKADGTHAVGFGARLGYWPCFSAPFVVLYIWKWTLHFWCGFGKAKKENDYRRLHRAIVDAAFNAALQSTTVPSTAGADRIIERARQEIAA